MARDFRLEPAFFIDCVPPPLSQKYGPLAGQIPDQFLSFHAGTGFKEKAKLGGVAGTALGTFSFAFSISSRHLCYGPPSKEMLQAIGHTDMHLASAHQVHQLSACCAFLLAFPPEQTPVFPDIHLQRAKC